MFLIEWQGTLVDSLNAAARNLVADDTPVLKYCGGCSGYWPYYVITGPSGRHLYIECINCHLTTPDDAKRIYA